MFSTFNWPPWIETRIMGNEVQITVTHGSFNRRFIVPRGSISRETLQLAWRIKQKLMEQQAKLDKITENITK